MFKKILACGITIAISLTLISGCGANTSSSSVQANIANSTTGTPTVGNVNSDGTVNDPNQVEVDPNKLVLWSLFSGGDGQYMEQIIEDYNATNPAKQVQSVMLVWEDYYTKLATAVAAGKGPDIAISHVSKLPELVEQGIALPLDEYAQVSGTDWSSYTDAMNQSVTFENEHYAIPLDTHAEILFFNKDILEKAGIPFAEDGTIDIENNGGFIELLEQLKQGIGDGETVLSLTQNGDDPYRIWWAVYFQMGGTPIINDDSTEITLDKEIALAAAEYVKSLYDDGYIAKGIEDHQQYFQSGKAALSFCGTWATGVFAQTENLNFGAQNFPTLFDNDACWADAHTLFIPASKTRSEEDTQAVMDFINYVSSVGAYTWAESGQIPSNIVVNESQEYLDMPYRRDYVAAAANAVFPSKTPYFYTMKDTMIRNLDTIWLGQVDPSTGIDNLQEQLELDIM